MKHLILILSLVQLLSCANDQRAMMVSEQEMLEAPGSAAAGEPERQPVDRKLIKRASWRFQAENVAQSTNRIEQMTPRYHAFIADSRLSMTSGMIEQRISIRVEPEYFEKFLHDLDSQARFTDYRNVTSTDVSKEFVDLESRLKTKQEVLERYKAILRNKTGTIEEVLAAERQIGQIQEEIEATISKLNLLKNQVSYSTIELQLYQYINTEASVVPGSGTRFANAFRAGLDGTVEFFIALAHIWPLMAVGLIVGLLYYRRRGK